MLCWHLSPEQPALHTSRRHDEAVCSNVEITNTFILVKLSWNRFNDHNYANLQSTIPRLCSLLSKWTPCVSRYGVWPMSVINIPITPATRLQCPRCPAPAPGYRCPCQGRTCDWSPIEWRGRIFWLVPRIIQVCRDFNTTLTSACDHNNQCSRHVSDVWSCSEAATVLFLCRKDLLRIFAYLMFKQNVSNLSWDACPHSRHYP